MGFPKIPDSQEIAAMVGRSLDPMLDLLVEIRDLLQENNTLQKESLAIRRETPHRRDGPACLNSLT